MSNIRVVFLSLCALSSLLFVGHVRADTIDCVRTAVGQVVVWRSAWQNDRQDEGVRYRINRVMSTLRSSEGVRVEIQALGDARMSTRMVEITSPSVAQLFCSALVRRKLSIPESNDVGGVRATLPPLGASPIADRRAAAEAENLPFIQFGDTGWVRADMPKNAELSICRISHMRFACTTSDKSRHAAYLKSIEEELRTLP